MQGKLHHPEARQQQGGQPQSQSQSQSQTSSQSGARSATSSSLSIPQSAPAGILTVTQPPQQSTSYYKVAQNQFITFGWNFSYILATPTHLTVSAVCENGNTYPVGPTDGIIAGTATSVVWDPFSYQTSHPNLPLAQAQYTLQIWGDGGPNAVRAPGVLTPNSALQFALYTPQAYTPIGSGWSCAGCSSAVSQHIAHPTFVGLIAAFMMMFISGSVLMRRI
ncbi:hypothetical protein AZE42_05704 [Rhizopogon vesiculosus]|uniref:DUF7137 domain-containing protein n=1 Tax=Rhizopogon vesiculosus TaxID=180088 RepID=A0A1J8QAI3_9AGAM|nr:hypothetical protein AZE42_05704 [Rhizopogon vesiculosus]